MDIYFTENHEWISIEADTGTIGITCYAAKQLGDITYVELPQTDNRVSKGESLCEIESVKAASDIYAPVSGIVGEVNQEIETSPEIVNSNPEDSGWIARIKISNPEELSSLMTKERYKEYIKNLG